VLRSQRLLVPSPLRRRRTYLVSRFPFIYFWLRPRLAFKGVQRKIDLSVGIVSVDAKRFLATTLFFHAHHPPPCLLEVLYLLYSSLLSRVEVRSSVGTRSPCQFALSTTACGFWTSGIVSGASSTVPKASTLVESRIGDQEPLASSGGAAIVCSCCCQKISYRHLQSKDQKAQMYCRKT